MRLIKVSKDSVGNNTNWLKAMTTIRAVLAEYELQERIDYECHYMSGTKEIHILLNDGNESIASVLALRFV